MGIHERHTLMQGVLRHDGVGVEQQDIFTIRLTDGFVVGTGKTQVLLVLDELNLRMQATQVFHRTVLATVVNHIHLRLNPFCCFLHRQEALMQEILYVIVDNDDVKFHRLGSFFFFVFGDVCSLICSASSSGNDSFRAASSISSISSSLSPM